MEISVYHISIINVEFLKKIAVASKIIGICVFGIQIKMNV